MPALDKWPRLLVDGAPVSQAQAKDILIRTDSWVLCTNDKGWERTVYRAAGIPLAQHGMPGWDELKAFRARMGVLDLSYLHNARIASSWIGGPHGWCDWDGRIGCSTYNIGKWPSLEEVTDDWQRIAATWPNLDLAAQLITEEGEGDLAGQWTIRGGQVEVELEPTATIRPPEQLSEDELAMITFRAEWTGRERGTHEGGLREALGQVAAGRGVNLPA